MKNAPTNGWQYARWIASSSCNAWSTPGPLPLSETSFAENAGTGAVSVSLPVYWPACAESATLW